MSHHDTAKAPRTCTHPEASPYRRGLSKNAANFAPLTPLSFLERAADTHPERLAVIDGAVRLSYGELRARCCRLASALVRRGVEPGDTVAAILPNTHPLLEAHLGVPMAGAVLNAINTRLDVATVAYILRHGEAKALLVDGELSGVAKAALEGLEHPPLVVDVQDPNLEGPGERVGDLTYDELLEEGDAGFEPLFPADEWQAISLNYTSGTTGEPKGVVYHHRGAYMNAIGNLMTWGMGHFPVYLWTLPMFHCNGWCFPWSITAMAGTHVCLRKVTGENVYAALAEHGVTHLCGAPVVMGAMLDVPAERRPEFPQAVKMMTAAAPPPAAVLERMEGLGVEVTHVYGLTEVYGPATVCAFKPEWAELPAEDRAAKLSRQGVRYPVLEGLSVFDPETLEPVPRDASTMGEIVMRGHDVMMGYLKNEAATDKAFRHGWFWTGDLGVVHPDGYVEIRDRSKDIIISGGENVSSIEVEAALYRHPAVAEAAVVAMPDEKWGEVPCAFVGLREGAQASEAELIAWCRERLAGFKTPKRIVFGPLPKTSTGKVQKFALREEARGGSV